MPYKTKEDRAKWDREYRAKRKQQGNPVPRGSDSRNGCPHGYDKPRQFIAWDGEGVNRETTTDAENREWTRHDLTLWAASTGETISGDKLKTTDVLDLILSVEERNPNAVHVMFAGNYDVTHILYDLPHKKIQGIEKPGGVNWKGYNIRYVPRKEFRITRGRSSVTLWDTFGFFQAKFSDVIEKWLGKNYPDLQLISQGKELREQFNQTDQEFIIKYNNAELTALVKIMDLLDISLRALNLNLRRWDGAGAIAAAMMKKHDFKRHIGKVLPEIEDAARYAYFGGRFEQGKYGHEVGEIHFHDINSAYPTTIVDLPSLASGIWIHGIPNNIVNFGLYKIRWNAPNTLFGPFGYRIRGTVFYPQRGENWVWGYELNAYMKWAYLTSEPALLDIRDAYYFKPHDPTYKPFAWVGEYYTLRQQIMNGETEYPIGAAQVLKLGINAIYGKTAQSVGYNPDTGRTPPYYSLLYAGAITSETRARVWPAAMQYGGTHTIMIATDGVFTTKKLRLPISDTKELGKWEYGLSQEIISIQSGIYTSKRDGILKIQSRGIDKKAGNDGSLADFILSVNQTVLDGYKSHADTVLFSSTRMINVRVAKQETLYDRRGYWVKNQRELKINPDSDKYGKRQTLGSPLKNPADMLRFTRPNFILQQGIDIGAQSEQYVRPWDYGRDDDSAFLEQELELWDTNW